VLSLLLFLLPEAVSRRFRITLPHITEALFLLFIFASEILGELGQFYLRFPHWDTLLHTIGGLLSTALGFSVIRLFHHNDTECTPLFCAASVFCFSMTVGVLWEFFEFGMDCFFQLDMQKDTVVHSISSVMLDPTGGNARIVLADITEVQINGQPLGLGGYLDIGLFDTMKDLLVNFVGAVVFSFVGFFFVRSRGEGRFARRFIPVRADWQEQTFPESSDCLPQNE
jgi:hypothetical protein